MTAIAPDTTTITCDPKTRQLTGTAIWTPTAHAGEIEVIVPIPDGEAPPYFQGAITVKTIAEAGEFIGEAMLGADGAWFAVRPIEHRCAGADAHACLPPLAHVPIDAPPSRTGVVWRFAAYRPANCEVVVEVSHPV